MVIDILFNIKLWYVKLWLNAHCEIVRVDICIFEILDLLNFFLLLVFVRFVFV